MRRQERESVDQFHPTTNKSHVHFSIFSTAEQTKADTHSLIKMFLAHLCSFSDGLEMEYMGTKDSL